jgi:pantothenate kinase
MSCKKNKMEGVSDNCVRTDYQNNKSSKMLQSEMIKNRKKIAYNNSRVNNIYNIILNGNYEDNLKLSKNIGVDAYRIYWRQILLSRISFVTKNKINEFYSIANPNPLPSNE